mmetsp:Transcript_13734/g.16688  ORF Transcript_13734/g.16688 Transcript_13734/m.16688 type:complete len:83 (+) Transcript_13734:103-351(+)
MFESLIWNLSDQAMNNDRYHIFGYSISDMVDEWLCDFVVGLRHVQQMLVVCCRYFQYYVTLSCKDPRWILLLFDLRYILISK